MKTNKTVLAEKIRIMAFLELLFSLPKNDRHVSFETIAKVAKVGVNDVEMLVMRVMSLNLVKGKIDQVDIFSENFEIFFFFCIFSTFY